MNFETSCDKEEIVYKLDLLYVVPWCAGVCTKKEKHVLSLPTF